MIERILKLHTTAVLPRGNSKWENSKSYCLILNFLTLDFTCSEDKEVGIFLFIFVALYPIFLYTLGMGYIGIIRYSYIYSKRDDT